MAPLPLPLGQERHVAGLLLQPPQGGEDLAAAPLARPLLLLRTPHGPSVGAVVVREEGRRGHPENGSGPRRRHPIAGRAGGLVILGTVEGEILIRTDGVLVRLAADGRADDRGDWIEGRLGCELSLDAVAHAERKVYLRREALAGYGRGLEALHRSLDGEARLAITDPGGGLTIRLARGRGTVSGEIPVGVVADGVGGALTFKAPIDQSWLPEAIAGVGALLERRGGWR